MKTDIKIEENVEEGGRDGKGSTVISMPAKTQLDTAQANH